VGVLGKLILRAKVCIFKSPVEKFPRKENYQDPETKKEI
jgi:hypothetical protein